MFPPLVSRRRQKQLPLLTKAKRGEVPSELGPQKLAQLFPSGEKTDLEGRLQRLHSQGPVRIPPVLGQHRPPLLTSDSATLPSAVLIIT
jgi:hypothetical protein